MDALLVSLTIFVIAITIIFVCSFYSMQKEIDDLKKQISYHEHWEE